jgi:biopolymer transport protein ExbB/TolQ
MIYEFMVQGGPWMIPILLVSVAGLTFILERAWFWFLLWARRDDRLRRRLLHGDPPPADARTRDPRAEVLLCLALHPKDEELAVERARMLVRDSRANLKTIAVAAGLGSALGLFGTVVGMSQSFGSVSLSDPAGIVAGLKTALNTTVLGLIVYLGCYCAHALFLQTSANLSQDLEEDLNEVRRAQKHRREATA